MGNSNTDSAAEAEARGNNKTSVIADGRRCSRLVSAKKKSSLLGRGGQTDQGNLCEKTVCLSSFRGEPPTDVVHFLQHSLGGQTNHPNLFGSLPGFSYFSY